MRASSAATCASSTPQPPAPDAATPIPVDVRDAVLADIQAGVGRNAIARAHGISAGSVLGIAHTAGAFFPRCVDTATATRARQIDLAAERVEREAVLWETYLATPARQDGTEPRSVRRASYALYNLNRKSPPSSPSSRR